MAPLAPLASDPWRCTPPALAENQPGRALLLHTAPALTPEQAQALAASGVPAVEGKVAELVIANGRVSGLCLRTVEVISREIVVAGRSSRRTPISSVFSGWRPSHWKQAARSSPRGGRLSPSGRTGTPGVWVAGDVADPMGQVIAAAVDGMRAGAAINIDLMVEDTAAAVAVCQAASALTTEQAG